MPTPPPDDHLLWQRIYFYALSAIIGLGAKLATLNAKDKLTLKEGLRNIFISALAFLIVYNLCIIYDVPSNAGYIYVAVAVKFSDSVVVLTWQVIKSFITKWNEETPK